MFDCFAETINPKWAPITYNEMKEVGNRIVAQVYEEFGIPNIDKAFLVEPPCWGTPIPTPDTTISLFFTMSYVALRSMRSSASPTSTKHSLMQSSHSFLR